MTTRNTMLAPDGRAGREEGGAGFHEINGFRKIVQLFPVKLDVYIL